mmetsp:Transcript_27263/g.55792  ORF Transcript_27263/g.55792 Transcript_27263/m.55792 type:complete len:272 (+) Transcript_27263:26-841(+)
MVKSVMLMTTAYAHRGNCIAASAYKLASSRLCPPFAPASAPPSAASSFPLATSSRPVRWPGRSRSSSPCSRSLAGSSFSSSCSAVERRSSLKLRAFRSGCKFSSSSSFLLASAAVRWDAPLKDKPITLRSMASLTMWSSSRSPIDSTPKSKNLVTAAAGTPASFSRKERSSALDSSSADKWAVCSAENLGDSSMAPAASEPSASSSSLASLANASVSARYLERPFFSVLYALKLSSRARKIMITTSGRSRLSSTPRVTPSSSPACISVDTS